MKIKFDSVQEQSQVLATLNRLLDETHERSHSTGERMNLAKAILCVEQTNIEEDNGPS